MRKPLTSETLLGLMNELGARVRQPARIYFTGGATSLLFGWRSSTIDVDLAIVAERDDVLRELPRLKEELKINIELASPADFIPELPGWQERSRFIARKGVLDFFHYDFYAQALSKLERGHERDLSDVERMAGDGLIDPPKLKELFDAIESELHRFPAIDPPSFRRAVQEWLA